MCVSLLRGLRALQGLSIDDHAIARLAQRVETDFVGAPVGIMDQMACSLGRPGEALFVDTRAIAFERIPWPAAAELVVIDSGVSHQHAGGEYVERRRESFAAAAALGVSHLRDVGVDALPAIARLPDVEARRARHIVTENQRVLDAVAALRAGDLPAVGALFGASHASMRDDYEITTPEIDALVALGQADPAIYGARMTGGGFGGAVVMLARAGEGRAAAERIAAAYGAQVGRQATILAPLAIDGARRARSPTHRRLDVQNRRPSWRFLPGGAPLPGHWRRRRNGHRLPNRSTNVNAIRLVLADDHATIRDALKLLLSGQPDLQVVGEAVDGQQAIDAAVALKPDVLLMDVSMPGLNGLQATAAVRQRAPGVKVLTLTRHAEESYLGELLRAGAAGYALKQSSSAELINAIRTVASGRPYLDPELNHGLMGLFVQGRTFRKPPDLTPRETEVLRLTAWGHSNKEIASQLGLSVKTVEVHKTNGMRKLGMNSRLQLVRYALLRNWFQDT